MNQQQTSGIRANRSPIRKTKKTLFGKLALELASNSFNPNTKNRRPLRQQKSGEAFSAGATTNQI
jgi:hypothetical protein